MTPDKALILSILSGGIQAFNTVKQKGVSAKDLYGNEAAVFTFIESFIKNGRLPSYLEIETLCKIKLDPPAEQLDPKLFADVIIKRALSTKLNDGIGSILEKITKDPVQAREELIELLHKTSLSTSSTRSTGDALTIEEVENRYLTAESRPTGLLGLSSPWPSLDKQSLGLENGSLHVILAKKKAGKSNSACAWVEHIWTHDLKENDNILVVSMEMPAWQINQRIFAVHNKLDYQAFRSGKLIKQDRDKFINWCQEMKQPSNRPKIITVDSSTVKNVSDITALTAQYRPKLVLVDAFYILGKSSNKPKWERTLENAEALKLDLASTMNVPVIATTQLSSNVGAQELDADVDAAAFAKNLIDYVDAAYGLFMDEMLRAEEKRIFRVIAARDFVPLSLLINFNMTTQDYSEIKCLDNDDIISGSDEADDIMTTGNDQLMF